MISEQQESIDHSYLSNTTELDKLKDIILQRDNEISILIKIVGQMFQTYFWPLQIFKYFSEVLFWFIWQKVLDNKLCFLNKIYLDQFFQKDILVGMLRKEKQRLSNEGNIRNERKETTRSSSSSEMTHEHQGLVSKQQVHYSSRKFIFIETLRPTQRIKDKYIQITSMYM